MTDQELRAKLWDQCEYTTDEDVSILVEAHEISQLGGDPMNFPVEKAGMGVWVPVVKVREYVLRNARHHMFDEALRDD